MTGTSEPDVRPVGALAVGAAVLSGVLAVTYFLSPLAYLPAALAVGLGAAARREERTRALGTTALVIASAAVVWASAVLVLTIRSSG